MSVPVERAGSQVGELLVLGEQGGWKVDARTVAGPADEMFDLTHQAYPSLRVEVFALNVQPYFHARLLVDRKERAVYRNFKDVRLLLEEPAATTGVNPNPTEEQDMTDIDDAIRRAERDDEPIPAWELARIAREYSEPEPTDAIRLCEEEYVKELAALDSDVPCEWCGEPLRGGHPACEWSARHGALATALQAPGPCGCECNHGGFCGGCGHAGCGGRR
jgi:hypothetical protein